MMVNGYCSTIDRFDVLVFAIIANYRILNARVKAGRSDEL
jgi:hypothetical protein